MNGKINEALLEHLVREVGLFPPAAPHGRMERKIKETGSYEEAGMCYVADDFKVGLHYAGLAVLARDMHRYLADHPRSDAAFFEQVVSLVHGEDSKLYGGGAFPNYQGLPTDNFPEGLASAADAGQIVVVPLGDLAIVHEWTFKPGKRLFVKFCSKFKETICDKNSHSPKEQFKNWRVRRRCH